MGEGRKKNRYIEASTSFEVSGCPPTLYSGRKKAVGSRQVLTPACSAHGLKKKEGAKPMSDINKKISQTIRTSVADHG